MEIGITLKNYRCFTDSNPARFTLKDGFTSFVGVNNAGKSSLLKFFYEFRTLFAHLASARHIFDSVKTGGYTAFPKGPSILDHAEVFCNRNSRAITVEFEFEGNTLTIEVPRGPQWTFRITQVNNITPKPPDGIGLGDGKLLTSGSEVVDLSVISEAFDNFRKSAYIGPFRNVLPLQAGDPYFDVWVGQQFVTAWRDFKTGDKKDQNEKAAQVTNDIRRIFGFADLDINPSTSGNTLKLLIDGKSYQLSELGGGLAQFIIVLVNAAMKRPSYILIDEPELGLHPSLQLDFLTTLASYSEHAVVLFATHSIGLARSASDQIYSVSLAEDGSEVKPYEETRHLAEFLGELSYSGYRELGFDKILLVEGVTDVRTILQFLRVYKKEHQVVLMPLGGSQFINGKYEVELTEVKRISGDVLALIDSEKTGPKAKLSGDRKVFVKVCEQLGIGCHVLEDRSIENYLSDRAIKKVKGPKYAALEPYQQLDDCELPWGKSENWRIAREMTLAELKDNDLGKFLAAL